MPWPRTRCARAAFLGSRAGAVKCSSAPAAASGNSGSAAAHPAAPAAAPRASAIPCWCLCGHSLPCTSPWRGGTAPCGVGPVTLELPVVCGPLMAAKKPACTAEVAWQWLGGRVYSSASRLDRLGVGQGRSAGSTAHTALVHAATGHPPHTHKVVPGCWQPHAFGAGVSERFLPGCGVRLRALVGAPGGGARGAGHCCSKQ
jgi:hypothetical protein